MENLLKNNCIKSPSCFKDREKFLPDLIQNEKSDVRLLEWVGFLALENKDWEMAENLFSSLLERRSKVIDLVGLGKALASQLRLEEAEECFLETLDKILEPCDLLFVVYKSLGEIHFLKNDFPMAEEYYNKASTLYPHSKSLSFHKGLVYLKERNYKEAEFHFKTFIKLNFKIGKVWLGLAITRKALGDEDLAMACLNRCLDFEPTNKKALKLKRKWKIVLLENLADSFSFSA